MAIRAGGAASSGPSRAMMPLRSSPPFPRATARCSRVATQRHVDLDWSAGAYVCHVGDNLRIWAERLAGVALGAFGRVSGYDADLLARARDYDGIPIEASLWSLERAADDWTRAFRLAVEGGVVMVHAERGEQTVLDVARTNAHDAYHHQWDISRSFA